MTAKYDAITCPQQFCHPPSVCVPLIRGGFRCDGCSDDGNYDKFCRLRTRSFKKGSYMTFPSIKTRNRFTVKLRSVGHSGWVLELSASSLWLFFSFLFFLHCCHYFVVGVATLLLCFLLSLLSSLHLSSSLSSFSCVFFTFFFFVFFFFFFVMVFSFFFLFFFFFLSFFLLHILCLETVVVVLFLHPLSHFLLYLLLCLFFSSSLLVS